MNKLEHNEVETERLFMKKLNHNNLDNYYEIMKKDEVGMWLSTSRGKTYEETKLLIDKFSKHWEEKGYGVWGVFNKSSEELLGHCGLNFLNDTQEVELLYAFDPKFWGFGYATEAAKASLEFAFESAKLHRIIALAKPDNKRSCNVIEKVGFTYIGIKGYFGLMPKYFELINNN